MWCCCGVHFTFPACSAAYHPSVHALPPLWDMHGMGQWDDGAGVGATEGQRLRSRTLFWAPADPACRQAARAATRVPHPPPTHLPPTHPALCAARWCRWWCRRALMKVGSIPSRYWTRCRLALCAMCTSWTLWLTTCRWGIMQ